MTSTNVRNPAPGYSDGFGSLAQFSTLAGIVSDRFDNLYVADSLNNRVRYVWLCLRMPIGCGLHLFSSTFFLFCVCVCVWTFFVNPLFFSEW
jgi:hypothetical protein